MKKGHVGRSYNKIRAVLEGLFKYVSGQHQLLFKLIGQFVFAKFITK